MSLTNKDKQLGMKYGTACHRLYRMIMFLMLQELGRDVCFRCGKRIETVEEFSVDHKKPWLHESVELFWDLRNIAFSHKKCNFGHARHREAEHGIWRYQKYRCRCEVCRAAKAKERRRYSKEKASQALADVLG